MIDADHPADRPVITEAPHPDDLHELLTALVASRPASLNEDRRPLAAFIRDDVGVLVGGISGHTHFGWLVIAQLWVAETHRGRHLGRDLLLAAEHEAQQRSCHSAWLDTYSFQAKPFYEAHGYRLFGELERYPAPHTKQFLVKHL